MARKKHLEAIRERYKQAHGPTTDDSNSRTNSITSIGSSNESITLGEQDFKRYNAGYVGRDTTSSTGIEAGQGFDREFYRGDGLSDGQAEFSSGRPYQDYENTDQLPTAEQPAASAKQPAKRIRLSKITPVRKSDDDSREHKKPSQQPLTKREADDLRDKLTMAYIHLFRGADDIIRVTNGSHEFFPIWSGIDDSDISILVNARLAAAQKSAREAKVVLTIIHAWERMITLFILMPRFWQTYQVYSEFGFQLPVSRRRKKVHERAEQRTEQRETANNSHSN